MVEVLDGNAGMLALVDVLGAQRPINLGMLEDIAVEPGEWVLIHMGFAFERVSESQAEKAMSGLEMMGRRREPEEHVVPEALLAPEAGAVPDG